MPARTQRLSRRNFLLTLGAGGAATAAAALTARGPVSAVSGDNGKRATRGYHATGHVADYYRTAKV